MERLDRDIDLRKLNSATQYPSIPTYHVLGQGGILTESGNPFADYDGDVYATEKIDGTNGRIICFDDDWIIGSRGELLAAAGDRVVNPTLGIVDTLRPYAQNRWVDTEYQIYVYFLEVYGHRALPAWKTYGDGKVSGARLFDVAVIPLEVLEWPIERIASWRDSGGQTFLTVPELHMDSLPLVPYIETFPGKELPVTIQDTRFLLSEQAPATRAEIDFGMTLPGLPEGIVFRTGDRSIIVKARYQDYDRTLKRKRQ